MVILEYSDWPKLNEYFIKHVWVQFVGPDFREWVKESFNCDTEVSHDLPRGSCWVMKFENDEDATAFRLRWS